MKAWIITAALLPAAATAGGRPYTVRPLECDRSCTTTVEVLGCSGPVRGAEVELTLRCQTEHAKKTTGDNGRAVFDYCIEDIVEKRINGLVNRKLEISGGGGSKDALIQVHICTDGDRLHR